MKIRFLGAAWTVTGSCSVVSTKSCRFAVDCGLHQGNREIDARNWDLALYEPEKIDFLLITHAHIDHTGLLPRLVKKGFKGPVYTTRPTHDLMEIMLQDSAYIQEMEARWKNKKRLRHGQKALPPLYSKEDVLATLPLISTRAYNEPFTPAPGVRVNFKDAGHILGSAFIEIWVEEEERTSKLVFSGDLGRPDQMIIRDPSIVEKADFLFLESTYGNRDHKDLGASEEEMAEAIAYSYQRGEKVIIPAFAVGRTQELIFCLYHLHKQGRLPGDMPVYIDSPMATRATEVFRNHPEFFDKESRELLANGESPFDIPQVRYTQSTQESIALNNSREPSVIISASGMCNAGRIKHHLRHNLWREGASVVFVGFQAQGTPGRRIVDGADMIRLFGENVAVKARVFTIGGFSAHAGQSQILEWLSHFTNGSMQVFLLHGEYGAQQALAKLVRERTGLEVSIPDYLEECLLTSGRKIARSKELRQALPPIDWKGALGDAQDTFERLQQRLEHVSKLTREEQAEVRDELVDLNSHLERVISEIAGA
ncbi:MAG: MBL fold metallo-hydrolase RNA specificity domain-containing protein [Desulfohalobiaceae bacterium]